MCMYVHELTTAATHHYPPSPPMGLCSHPLARTFQAVNLGCWRNYASDSDYTQAGHTALSPLLVGQLCPHTWVTWGFRTRTVEDFLQRAHMC